MTSKKKVLLCSKCMIFSRRSKIWEQHILKSLEKKKLWNNYWPVDTKKKLYFFVGQNFFFSVAWPSALRATEKKNLCNKKKIFFWINGQKLFQSFFLFQLLKIFIITNIYKKFFPKICDRKVTEFCSKKQNKIQKQQKRSPFFGLFSLRGGDKKKHFHYIILKSKKLTP